MSANPITWVSVKQDWDGVPCVAIRRESHEGVIEQVSWYRPSGPSQQRVLRQVEHNAGEHLISLGFGAITGKLNLLLHLNLPAARLPRVNTQMV